MPFPGNQTSWTDAGRREPALCELLPVSAAGPLDTVSPHPRLHYSRAARDVEGTHSEWW